MTFPINNCRLYTAADDVRQKGRVNIDGTINPLYNQFDLQSRAPFKACHHATVEAAGLLDGPAERGC